MIRALRLTDVVAYLAFRNRAVLNEALLQPEDTPSTPSLRSGFLGRSFELGRQSWVHLDHGQLDGLVAARPRVGGDVWDVDQLIVMPTAEASTVYRELLGHLSAAARDGGVQKVFLRVRSDSPAQLSARRAGFFEYTHELVYRLPEVARRAELAPAPFRPRRRVHHHAIFQLYSAAVPCQVRAVEGMTLQEWRLADGWGFRPTDLRVGLSPRRRDFVHEREGKVVAWLQVDTKACRLHLLTHPNESSEPIRATLRYGLEQLRSDGPATCAVRAYQPLLAGLLEEEGFGLRAEHTLLGQSLAVRLPQRQFVPARA